MTCTSLTSKDPLLRYLGVAFGAALFFAASTGAAQIVTATITVSKAGAAQNPACTWPPQGGFWACVSPDPIYTSDVDGPVAIWWTLDANTVAAGWVFDSNGINITDPNKKWVTVAGPGPTQYIAVSKKDKKQYPYKVNLIQAGTSLKLDPTIMN